jgi:uncharacterized protein (DUF427 family)
METFDMWTHRGKHRPAFAMTPAAGQESVWDYPRPPALLSDSRHITITWGDTLVLSSDRAVRVLETASPPTFYFPPDALTPGLLHPDQASSYCEWKGTAHYWQLRRGQSLLRRVAWCYPQPTPAFQAIAGWLAFYPHQLDCRVDGERVMPQGGEYYGGWVTREIVGPWKGSPDTGAW